ncbi:MAG: sugar transferase [Candidatus Eisenbacteria sp.]|nr:sugar transferase [Candidatus Eisenbacteria bacterium]
MRATAINHSELTSGELGKQDAGPIAGGRRRVSWSRAIGLVLPGFLLLDALLITGGLFGALQLTPGARQMFQHSAADCVPPLAALFTVLVLGFFILGGMFGLYDRRSLLRPDHAATTAAKALFWSGFIAVAFDFLLALDPPGNLRRLLITHAFFLSAGVLIIRPLVCRFLVPLAMVGSIRPRRLLVAGLSPKARRVASALEASDCGASAVVGLVDLEVPSISRGRLWPRFQVPTWEDLPQLARALATDEVVIASSSIERSTSIEIAGVLAQMGIETSIVPHLTRLFVDAAPVSRERGVPLLRLGRPGPKAFGLHIKRVLDFMLALCGSLVFLPLMLLIAALVKLTSPGPILHAQTRVGKNGKLFKMYKFRSMVVSNDDRCHREYVSSLLLQGHAAGVDPSGRPIYKILDDPRITLVGKLLRRASLDELPQLFNVLCGEMSLIGPRPCLSFEYDLYEPWQKHRLDVTPGMTGLWQVSGRNFLGFEEMVLLDLFYISNWSFLLDLRLLWRTMPEVLYAKGAR